MNLDNSEIDHLLFLVERSKCIDKTPDGQTVCNQIALKLRVMANADKQYWRIMERRFKHDDS